jgi:holin-like protein
MYIKQLLILVAAAFAGSEAAVVFQLPVPATVIGLIILFAALLTRIVKLKDVEDSAMFIIDNLSVFFVVPTVALMMYFDVLSRQLIQIAVPMVGSIVLGMFAAGKVTELTIRLMRKRQSGALDSGTDTGKKVNGKNR